MTTTPQTCTCTESSSRDTHIHTHTHIPTDTHIHTRVRAWHDQAQQGTHLGTCTHAGQTGSRFCPLAVPLDVREGRARGPELPARGAALLLPRGHLGVLRLVPGRKRSVLLSTGNTQLRLGPPRPPGHHSWLHTRCTGLCRTSHYNQFELWH